MTREEAAIIGAFTGVLLGPPEDVQSYVQRRTTADPGTALSPAEIKELARPDMMKLYGNMLAAEPTKMEVHDYESIH